MERQHIEDEIDAAFILAEANLLSAWPTEMGDRGLATPATFAPTAAKPVLSFLDKPVQDSKEQYRPASPAREKLKVTSEVVSERNTAKWASFGNILKMYFLHAD
jgi:hypothetical protein